VESYVVCIVRLSALTATVRPVTPVFVTKVRLSPDRKTLTEMYCDLFSEIRVIYIVTVAANPCLTNVMSAHMAIYIVTVAANPCLANVMSAHMAI
jgi:hypothetical protein